MSYVHYLITVRKTDEEIEQILINETDVEERKRKPKDYIERTIQRARRYRGACDR